MQIVKNSNVLAMDPSSSMKNLKNLKNIDSQENAKEVSEQFEALFLQMVLKSMRDAINKDDLFSTEHNETYTNMFDQQLAYNMSKANGGIGFAKQIENQIMLYINNKNGFETNTTEATKSNPIPNFTGIANKVMKTNALINEEVVAPKQEINNQKISTKNTLEIPPSNINSTNMDAAFEVLLDNAKISLKETNTTNNITSKKKSDLTPKNFIQEILKDSFKASADTGVPPQFILGHAALESGWGKYIPTDKDGNSSFNIFSVKATKNWTGKTIDVATTEYINGQPQNRVEKFKAYDSYAEAFKDYVSTLKNNSRYNSVTNAQTSYEFANGLQKAGYATDPLYAQKLEQLINGNRLKQSITA